MIELARPYGAPDHTSADPVLQWLAQFWGWPVRIHVIELRDDYWLHGVVTSIGIDSGCLFTRMTIVEIRIRDENDQEVSIWIDTTAGGNLLWDSPMKRELRIVGNNGQSRVICDDRPIRHIDAVEGELAKALAAKDPVQRHELLAYLGGSASKAAENEPDDTLRARLVGLSVFLEGYHGPWSVEGDGA